MTGVMIDAYKLRKKTNDAAALFNEMFERHPNQPQTELKTKRFIAGKDDWNVVPGQERADFIRALVQLAVGGGGKIYAVAFSFERFTAALAGGHGHPFGDCHWTAASLFVSALIQKKMQTEKSGKGLTVFVMDNHKARMPRLLEGIHAPDPWFDPLFQVRAKTKAKPWKARTAADRFDHILNTAFPIDSKHSHLVQVADAVAFVYRCHLEIASGAPEAYAGEAAFYRSCVELLEPARMKLGQTPRASAVDFYNAAKHPQWSL